MPHATRRSLAAGVVAVLLSVSGVSTRAAGTTRHGDPSLSYARTAATCRTAILNVWDNLLRGGPSWRHDFVALRPLVAGGAPTAARAATTVARTRGLVPICSLITVSYAARSLALVSLFGGPNALAHLRAQWSSMSSAQRSAFEQHLFYGEPSSVSLSAGSVTILTHGPTNEKVRVVIVEHLTGATTTSSATVSVVRLAGRWYVSSLSSLSMNVG